MGENKQVDQKQLLFKIVGFDLSKSKVDAIRIIRKATGATPSEISCWLDNAINKRSITIEIPIASIEKTVSNAFKEAGLILA